MKPRKFELIECPHCGREYLPAEIFIPNAFFGRPDDIVRDVCGRILDYEGTSVDNSETYTCDKCKTEFSVYTRLLFLTESTKVGNMDEPYVTPVHKNTLFMEDIQ